MGDQSNVDVLTSSKKIKKIVLWSRSWLWEKKIPGAGAAPEEDVSETLVPGFESRSPWQQNVLVFTTSWDLWHEPDPRDGEPPYGVPVHLWRNHHGHDWRLCSGTYIEER